MGRVRTIHDERRVPTVRRSLITVVALALAVAWSVPAGADDPGARSVRRPPRVVTTFATDASFAESLVVDGQGDVYASVTYWGAQRDSGRIWKISPDGQKSRFGPRIDAGLGILSGMVFDTTGNLYVAVATFSHDPRPHVLRIGVDGSVVSVAQLPAASFPNGLAYHDDALYITDSALGVIWRFLPSDASLIRWLEDPVLLPGDPAHGIGANGIAFKGQQLYVAVSDPGIIVQVPLQLDGTAGDPAVFSRKHVLATADGLVFDPKGRMWVATNEDRLLRLSPDGSIFRFADGAAWLNYPTTVAFGVPLRGTTKLYIENGAFEGGTPNILATKVRIAGS